MRNALLSVLLILAGCALKPTTFKPVPPPLPPTPGMANMTGQRTLAVAPEALSSVTATPAAGIGSFSIARSVSNSCAIIAWSVRPVNYAIEVSTNLAVWQNVGQNIETNFVLAPNQVFVSTALFPSGKAVKFNDGTPVIEFLDYDIGMPRKFYRIREINP